MGLFDWFNKKDDSKKEESDRDSVVKVMSDWIAHPMEFGKPPETITIVDQRLLYWPSQQNEQCYLLDFTVDGDRFIGFTGPITWTFFAIDYKKLSFEQLYIRYTGWYIVFATINDAGYDKTLEGLNQDKVITDLRKKGLTDISISQKAALGGTTYYEFLATEGGGKVRVVGTEGDMHEYPMDYILPYYEYIGISWDPLNV